MPAKELNNNKQKCPGRVLMPAKELNNNKDDEQDVTNSTR